MKGNQKHCTILHAQAAWPTPMESLPMLTMSFTEEPPGTLGLRCEDLFWRLRMESSLKDCDMSTVPSIIVAGAAEEW